MKLSRATVVSMLLLGGVSPAGASTPDDFDADGKTDITVYRPSTGDWYVRQSSTGFTTFTITQWGLPGDVPVAADYDGDGQTDYAVWRRNVPWVNPGHPSEWYVLLSTTGYSAYLHYYFGLASDVPVPADYDGDGMADVAVYRPADGTWHVLRSSVAPASRYIVYANVTFGPPGTPTRFTTDYPVPADYDGDGMADLAVYRRPSRTWYFRLSSTELLSSITFGDGIDRPVPGDYDGDGRADLALYRPLDGMWSVLSSAGGAPVTTSWGIPGDTPVPGDYDGDGTTDIAIFRPSNGFWHMRNAAVAWQWALSGDVPVPNAIVASATRRIGASTDAVRGTDFDGDGRSDISIYRPGDPGTFWDPGTSSVWHSLKSTTNYTTFSSTPWGLPGDVLVPGDWHGDGISKPTIWRPAEGNWYFMSLPRALYRFFSPSTIRSFGLSSDVPIAADFDGDGLSDIAVFRPSTGGWDRDFSSWTMSRTFCPPGGCAGAPGDLPVPADYDGDGKTDTAVYTKASGVWTIDLSSTLTQTTVLFPGGFNGVPVPADYDGDGMADVAIFDTSSGFYTGLLSSQYAPFFGYAFHVNGGSAVPGDYDGDGAVDLAVYNPATGEWKIALLRSAGPPLTYSFGTPGDIPVGGKQ